MLVDCPQFSAVVPVTLTKDHQRPEAWGSGVMVHVFGSEGFFTAAHVLDAWEKGILAAPRGDLFVPLSGEYWQCKPPRGGREKDLLDIGYVLPDSDVPLDPNIARPLTEDEIQRDAHLAGEHNAYTFVGYPFRKTRRRGVMLSTAQQRFTGSGLSPEDLRLVGLDPKVHIAIKFRRRKTVSGPNDTVKTAPLPHGMSGGGIFAWPKPLRGLKELPRFYPLVGIAHTYLEEKGLLVGTRIEFLMKVIQDHLK